MKKLSSRAAVDRLPRRSNEGKGRKLGPGCRAFFAACLLLPILVVGTAAAGGVSRSRAPSPGKWIKIGTTQGGVGSPAALWRGPDNRDWVVWQSDGHTYEVVLLGANGGISKAGATALHWSGGLAGDPTLLGNGKTPLLVFTGQSGGKYGLGCVTGALAGSTPWKVQAWSLSHYCDSSNVGYGSAARNAKGVISAAWAAIGGGVFYRIGIANSIPAASPDHEIVIPSAGENFFSEAVDSSGNGHFYLAFNRFFSKPAGKDGIYVTDLTANGPMKKAPGSSTYTRILQNVAFANSTHRHGGVYAAYCSNNSVPPMTFCSRLLLWHYGAKKALVVPSGFGSTFVAMASGPDGRLWLAWWKESNNVLYTVRTNKGDTRFGPVEAYDANKQLFEANNIAVGGGNFGRLDVVVAGLGNNGTGQLTLATQSLTALALSPGKKTIDNATSNKVTFKVTDAGDPVVGATVTVLGHSAKTGASGTATITFPKGTSLGTHRVTARQTNYFPATAGIVVTT